MFGAKNMSVDGVLRSRQKNLTDLEIMEINQTLGMRNPKVKVIDVFRDILLLFYTFLFLDMLKE